MLIYISTIISLLGIHNTTLSNKVNARPWRIAKEKNPLELLIEINAICRLWPFVKDSRRGANSQTKTKHQSRSQNRTLTYFTSSHAQKNNNQICTCMRVRHLEELRILVCETRSLQTSG